MSIESQLLAQGLGFHNSGQGVSWLAGGSAGSLAVGAGVGGLPELAVPAPAKAARGTVPPDLSLFCHFLDLGQVTF